MLSILYNLEMERFSSVFNQITHGKQNKLSIFDERTEESSAVQYFQVSVVSSNVDKMKL